MRARGRLVAGLGVAATLVAAAPAGASAGEVVAAGPGGTAHFAWSQFVPYESTSMQARHMSAAGTLGIQQTVSAVPATGDAGGEIGVGADGTAIIGFAEQVSGKPEVRMRRRTPAGSMSAPQTLSPAGAYTFGFTMAVEPDRDAIAVWTLVTANNRFVVQARRRFASGALSRIYTLSYAEGYAIGADVAVTPSGAATVVWNRRGPEPDVNQYVQTRTIAPDGSVSATQNLSPRTSSASPPQVVVSDAGVATIAWLREADKAAMYRVRAADGTVGSTVPIAASGVAFPDGLSIAGNAAGRTAFAWRESGDGETYDTKARLRAPGGPLHATFDVGGAGQQEFRPKVALDPQGNATFAWAEKVGSDRTVHVRRRSLAGSMGPLRVVSQPVGQADAPFLAVDADGKATVAWFVGLFDLFTRTVTPDGTVSPAIQQVNG